MSPRGAAFFTFYSCKYKNASHTTADLRLAALFARVEPFFLPPPLAGFGAEPIFLPPPLAVFGMMGWAVLFYLDFILFRSMR